MKRFFLVHGLKRSGNHGVINWLEAHDRFLFFNDIIAIDLILQGQKKIPSTVDFKAWLGDQFQPGSLYVESATETLHREGITADQASILASLEDHALQFKPFFGIPYPLKNILILRDPYNMLASRIKKASFVNSPLSYPTQPGPEMDRIVRLWKEHAREFLGLTNYLENRVGIYFNSWFLNSAYRERISKELGLPFTDRGFTKVSEIGGGSSFDGVRYDGENHKLDVLNRQQYLTDSQRETLASAVADPELQELAKKVTTVNEVTHE